MDKLNEFFVKTKHIWAIIIILVLAVGISGLYYNTYVEKVVTRNNYYEVIPTGATSLGFFTKGEKVVQKYVVADSFDGISVLVGTHDRENNSNYKVDITVDGVSYYSANINAMSLKDCQYCDFEFENPVSLTQQVEVIITIESLDAKEENCISLFYGSSSAGKNSFLVNGKAMDGSLNVKFFNKQTHPTIAKAYIAIAATLIVIALLAYILIVCLKMKTFKAFLIFALLLGTVMAIVVPPNTAPDEQAHYTTAYNYSNMILGCGSYDEEMHTIKMRACDEKEYTPELSFNKYFSVFSDFELFSDNTQLVTAPAAFVTTSPFYVYLPQTIGITLGRLMSLGKIATFYLARFFNAAAFIFLLCIAIKKIPFAKTGIAVIALFPIMLQQSFSLSSDSVINGLAFLLIAYVLNMIFGTKKISVADIVVLFVLSVLLAPCKITYFVVPFLAILISKDKFQNKISALVTKIGVPLSSVISLLVVQIGNIKNSSSSDVAYSISGVPNYSLADILANPAQSIEIFLHTIDNNFSFYVESAVIGPLGALQLNLPIILLSAFIILAVLSSFPNNNEKLSRKVVPTDRILAFLVFAASASLILLSMFISWTPRGSDIIFGVQGRYFLPVVPVLMLLFYSDKLIVSKDKKRIMLFASVLLTSFCEMFTFCNSINYI